jgi:hypothetical protein
MRDATFRLFTRRRKSSTKPHHQSVLACFLISTL